MSVTLACQLWWVDEKKAHSKMWVNVRAAMLWEEKGQGLSKASKEVLVKFVLQTTPTYHMRCFQLLKKTCRNLYMISSNFWWGAINGEKKCIGLHGKRCVLGSVKVGWVFENLRLSTKPFRQSKHEGSCNFQPLYVLMYWMLDVFERET